MLNRSPLIHAALLIAGVLSMLAARAQAAGPILLQTLVQARPSPKLGEAAQTYDWLIGDWDMVITDILEDGTTETHTGEWHFAWVLDGLAVQDVLISPRRGERAGDLGPNRYGSSIRVFDRQLNGWRVIWINPQTGSRNELVGRRAGADIVQVGSQSDGRPIRWTFTDITPDSATWKGESLADDGRTWRLEAEFKMRRATPNSHAAPQ
jgi:hypothetical protein